MLEYKARCEVNSTYIKKNPANRLRSANYGSRIDLILCSPGLRPWIKGGDIQSKVYGSDHCPVYIDLHECAEIPGKGMLQLRDMLNPPDRQPSTAPLYPVDPPRTALEPPRFATKFFEEFSGRQTSLKSFFGSQSRPIRKPSMSASLVSLSPTPGPAESPVPEEEQSLPAMPTFTPSAPAVDESLSAPFSLARAAFDSIDTLPPKESGSPQNAQKGQNGESITSRKPGQAASAIHTTADEGFSSREDSPKASLAKQTPTNGQSKKKSAKAPPSGQTKLFSFFAQPPSKAKCESPSPTPPPPKSQSSSPASTRRPGILTPPARSKKTEEEDQIIAHAIAESDAETASKRAATNAEAAPIWSSLLAKKLPPFCAVHQKPCRDYSQRGIFASMP